MTFTEWLMTHGAIAIFWLWILNWGGARVLEGIKSALFVNLFSAHWNTEQIRLYALVMLIAQIVWFAIGFFKPEYRVFSWA